MLNWIKKLDHKLFYPFAEEKKTSSYFKYRNIYTFPFTPVKGNEKFIDKDVAHYLSEASKNWRMLEFHFHYPHKTFIEPKHHWAITATGNVLKESAYSYFENKINKPFFFEQKIRRYKKNKVNEAISVHTGWMNYWHFYNDILGQLALAENAGLNDLPIIIPQGLFDKPYFQTLLEMAPVLQKKKWIIQGTKEKIELNSSHFFSAVYGHKKNFDAAIQWIRGKLIFNDTNKNKIFLTRNPSRRRFINNMSEIEPLLKVNGFDIVDTDHLNLQEQMDLFHSADIVMGIHGAAFTNIIFRQGMPLHVIEIFPENFLNPCFYWMSMQFGYDYSALSGSVNKESKDKSFHVDPFKIKQILNKIK